MNTEKYKDVTFVNDSLHLDVHFKTKETETGDVIVPRDIYVKVLQRAGLLITYPNPNDKVENVTLEDSTANFEMYLPSAVISLFEKICFSQKFISSNKNRKYFNIIDNLIERGLLFITNEGIELTYFGQQLKSQLSSNYYVQSTK